MKNDGNPVVFSYKKSPFPHTFPMKRLGTPEDIAKVVKFLALDTEYVTGQAIEVAGGLMI